MNKTLSVVLAGLIVGAPMAVASAKPAEAAPYKNCTQARQNSDCNIPSSSDKYQPKLDRDGDGIGCEC